MAQIVQELVNQKFYDPATDSSSINHNNLNASNNH